VSGGWGTPTWMQPGPEVGETFVQGKTQEVARGLLDAAKALGLDHQSVVRAVTGGFIVPNEVYDQWTAAPDLDTDTDDDQF